MLLSIVNNFLKFLCLGDANRPLGVGGFLKTNVPWIRVNIQSLQVQSLSLS